MLDHQGQIRFTATVATGLVLVSTVISYSWAYNADDVMGNNNLTTALSAQIQISVVLICMVRKLSMEPIFLAIRWDISSEKAQKTLQATMQRGIKTILHPSLLR